MAEYGAGAISRMSAISGAGNIIIASSGSPFNGAVATFVDGTPTANQGDFTATIDWGDGTRAQPGNRLRAEGRTIHREWLAHILHRRDLYIKRQPV